MKEIAGFVLLGLGLTLVVNGIHGNYFVAIGGFIAFAAGFDIIVTAKIRTSAGQVIE